MKFNSQLSDVLHVLLHLTQAEAPVTSEVLAAALRTNPVVLRRLMSGLRGAGFVSSEKGHRGGWMMSALPESITLRDVHAALGAPALVSLGFRDEHPGCLVAQVVNESLRTATEYAETVLLASLEGMTLARLSAGVVDRLGMNVHPGSPAPHRLEDHHDQY